MTRRRGSWAIAAASLAMLFVSASPAFAEMSCRRWEFQNSTFLMNQSNGFVIRIALGQSTIDGGFLRFGAHASINIERGGGGKFTSTPRFVPTNGALAFIVEWNPPKDRPNDSNMGVYTGEPSKIRQTGDGGLVADLAGWTTGEEVPETTLLDWQFNLKDLSIYNYNPRKHAAATWNAPAALVCRPANVLLDGQTAKDQRQLAESQRQAREDAAAAAPPPKPLRATGRARPSGPAGPSAFQGGWQTVTSQNGHFNVILQITNLGAETINGFSDMQVVGQILNTDGATQYNGSLQGVIPRGTRTLHYSYVQPGISGSGTGQFTLSDDGDRITGGGKAGDQTFTWNGTRAK